MVLSRVSAVVLSGVLGAGIAVSPQASGYDMDCEVILCLAGGFPAGCGEAYGYMIDRITQTPPLPPFGFCATSDGAGYTNYDVSYGFPDSETRAGWACAGDAVLRFSVSETENDDHVTRVGHGSCLSPDGRTTALPVHFVLDLTLEPGTAWEARYEARINYAIGVIE